MLMVFDYYISYNGPTQTYRYIRIMPANQALSLYWPFPYFKNSKGLTQSITVATRGIY
jgi:hypothetical protein